MLPELLKARSIGSWTKTDAGTSGLDAAAAARTVKADSANHCLLIPNLPIESWMLHVRSFSTPTLWDPTHLLREPFPRSGISPDSIPPPAHQTKLILTIDFQDEIDNRIVSGLMMYKGHVKPCDLCPCAVGEADHGGTVALGHYCLVRSYSTRSSAFGLIVAGLSHYLRRFCVVFLLFGPMSLSKISSCHRPHASKLQWSITEVPNVD